VRQRIERLLQKLEVFMTEPEQMRLLRAVEVLERIARDAQSALKHQAAKTHGGVSKASGR
jgi:hypothetical protein